MSSIASYSAANSESLKAATFQRLHPRVYFERFISESVRPDGRSFLDHRDLSINVGSISTADGSSLVRLGDTTVVCGVKAEIAEPSLEEPNRGYLVPNLDLPALCSPKFKHGPPGEEAQILSERLYDALTSSGLLPLESLCIEPGKSVWVIYLDAMCINYDGNVFDTALTAMVSALKNTKLSEATYREEEERTVCSRRGTKPLQISRSLVSTSFGVFDSAHLLMDPTSFEEPLLDTTLTVVVDDSGEVVSMTQMGMATSDMVSKCISLVKTRASRLLENEKYM